MQCNEIVTKKKPCNNANKNKIENNEVRLHQKHNIT